MFDWFWKFLYSITEILLELIDACLSICNKICGVEPIEYDGQKANFMTTLFKDSRVTMAFGGAALIGIFLLMIFGVFAICKNMGDGKKSNSRIVATIFKTLGLFFLVPTLMFAFTILLNELVKVLYLATQDGEAQIGSFLFKSFCPPGCDEVLTTVDYTSINSVKDYLAIGGYGLDDFRFFFSWIVCIPLLICIAKSLFLFVERTLSIIILFVMSPISMSTTVIDDGARFKIWRDKVLGKFISGYGLMISVNIYVIVLSFITSGSVNFFPGDAPLGLNSICDFVLKCAFAIGGAYFLPKVFGLIGDLFVQGAGTADWNANEQAMGKMHQDLRELKQDMRERARKKKEDEKEKKDRERRAKKAMQGRGGSGNNGSSVGKVAGGNGIAGMVANVASGIIQAGGQIAKTGIQTGKELGKTLIAGGPGSEGTGEGEGDTNQNTQTIPGGTGVKNAITNILTGNGIGSGKGK